MGPKRIPQGAGICAGTIALQDLTSDLGRAYNLLPINTLHLSAMRRAHIGDIASRDRDFERVDGIVICSP
jgi:predicted nucleic acid-binding protein